MLSVTPVTTSGLMETVSLSDETTSWGGHLEWPEESIDLLEVWTHSEDLVDDVLSTVNTEVTQLLGDHGVVSQWDSRTIDLEVTSLVDQLADRSERWMTEGDIWSNHSQHLRDWAVDLQEDTVVQLLQAEELQDLSWLWRHLVDTAKTGNEQ